jgi:hypothetical protein
MPSMPDAGRPKSPPQNEIQRDEARSTAMIWGFNRRMEEEQRGEELVLKDKTLVAEAFFLMIDQQRKTHSPQG